MFLSQLRKVSLLKGNRPPQREDGADRGSEVSVYPHLMGKDLGAGIEPTSGFLEKVNNVLREWERILGLS